MGCIIHMSYIFRLYIIKLNALKQAVALLADPVCLEVAHLLN
jgi:hypothetical protein